MFRHTHRNRLNAGCSADIGNARHLGDVLDFLIGLDHAHFHRSGCDIDKFHPRKGILQAFAEIDVHMIELHANALGALDQALQAQ